MGDMHVLATYTGWKDFGGVMAPSRIVQTRGGWPFFEVDRDGGAGQSCRSRDARSRTCRSWRRPGGGAPPAAGGRGGPAGQGGPAAPTGADRDHREAWRWCLPAHHWRRQLRLAGRGLPRPHHDARGGTESGAGARLHRRSEEAHPQQADPVRDEHARARRSHRRIAGDGGRRRDHHHAEEQRDVLHPGAEHADERS